MSPFSNGRLLHCRPSPMPNVLLEAPTGCCTCCNRRVPLLLCHPTLGVQYQGRWRCNHGWGQQLAGGRDGNVKRCPGPGKDQSSCRTVQKALHVDHGLPLGVQGLALQVTGNGALGDGLNQRVFQCRGIGVQGSLSSRRASSSRALATAKISADELKLASSPLVSR